MLKLCYSHHQYMVEKRILNFEPDWPYTLPAISYIRTVFFPKLIIFLLLQYFNFDYICKSRKNLPFVLNSSRFSAISNFSDISYMYSHNSFLNESFYRAFLKTAIISYHALNQWISKLLSSSKRSVYAVLYLF